MKHKPEFAILGYRRALKKQAAICPSHNTPAFATRRGQVKLSNNIGPVAGA
jgi:hypothetical protein